MVRHNKSTRQGKEKAKKKESGLQLERKENKPRLFFIVVVECAAVLVSTYPTNCELNTLLTKTAAHTPTHIYSQTGTEKK